VEKEAIAQTHGGRKNKLLWVSGERSYCTDPRKEKKQASVGLWRKKLMHRPTEGEKTSFCGSVEKEANAQTRGRR